MQTRFKKLYLILIKILAAGYINSQTATLKREIEVLKRKVIFYEKAASQRHLIKQSTRNSTRTNSIHSFNSEIKNKI